MICTLGRAYEHQDQPFIIIEMRVPTEFSRCMHAHKLRSHLEALGLLANLHNVFTSKFPLPPLVVLLLIGELCLVLQADQLSPRFLDGIELAELQLLHGLMVPQKHGMFQVLLGLTLVQLLIMCTCRDKQQGDEIVRHQR